MTTSQAPERTLLDITESQMQAEIDHLNGTITSKMSSMVHSLAGIKREIEAGTLYPSTNLTKQAAELDMLYTRLRYATDTLETLEALKAEQK
jgi:hypothetical protein